MRREDSRFSIRPAAEENAALPVVSYLFGKFTAMRALIAPCLALFMTLSGGDVFAQGGAPGSWFDSKLDIRVDGNGFADITYVFYNDSATLGFDPIYDRYKTVSAPGQPTIFTDLFGSDMLSYNGRSNADIGVPVRLGLDPGADGTFTFSFDGTSSFDTTTLLFLEDLQLGVWHDIRMDGDYVFDMTTADSVDRFVLHFTEPVAVQTIDPSCAGPDGSLTADLGEYVFGTPLLWDLVLRDSAGVTVRSLNDVDSVVTVDPLAGGSYELTLTHSGYSTTSTQVLDVPDRVVADATPLDSIEAGETLIVNNLSTGWTTSEWSVNGAPVSTTTDLIRVFDSAGVYLIGLDVSSADCSDAWQDSILVTPKDVVDTTSLALGAGCDLRAYGSGGQLVIDIPTGCTGGHLEVVEIDLLGRVLGRHVVRSAGRHRLGLAPGGGDVRWIMLRSEAAERLVRVHLF